jgi:hypothetical protein
LASSYVPSSPPGAGGVMPSIAAVGAAVGDTAAGLAAGTAVGAAVAAGAMVAAGLTGSAEATAFKSAGLAVLVNASTAHKIAKDQ